MTVYVKRDGAWVDKHTGAAMTVGRHSPVAMPYMRGDMKPYRSPITGEMIDGRAARREDLKKHGCREVDPSEFKPEYRNEKYRINNWRAQKAMANGDRPK